MVLRVGHEPRDRRVADAPLRPVRDPHQADGVGRVVEHLEVRRRVLDLGALVEARPTDHLVADLVQAQRLLEHSRLRVHPVEDRDLAAGVALLDEAGDLGGDVARLGLLVLDLDHPHRIAVAELRPEPLFLPLGVVRDHGVRRLENRVRRAVVLLERDRARLGEVALELQDVADVGAAEGVDRLVGIADRADVVMVLGEELQQAVLRVIRVLVLVDEDVPEGVLPVLPSVREVLQDLHGQHQHVVEVDGVRGGELALVQLVRLGDRLVVEGRDPLGVHRRRHELVLRVRDLRVHAAGDEALRDPSRAPPGTA